MKKVGVFIGRFQPLHLGHLETIERALTEVDELVIIIGSARTARNLRNPFTADERREMIEIALPKETRSRVRFEFVRDYFYNTAAWVAEVRDKATSGIVFRISSVNPVQVKLYGISKDATSAYLNWFPDWSADRMRTNDQSETQAGRILNATDLRESFLRDASALQTEQAKRHLPAVTAEWLRKFSALPVYRDLHTEQLAIDAYRKSWANAPFPPVFVTTDAVVIQAGHIVMIQRKKTPGRGQWAIPGGFLDPHELLEDCAIRELHEETQFDMSVEQLRKALVAVRTFDHPLRSTRGRTITHAHLFRLPGDRVAKIQANDDAAAAKWVPLLDVGKMEEQCFEDHFHIIHAMMNMSSRV
jgi:bifunctional NMN adenylyltransferase/nudix hydrolase